MMQLFHWTKIAPKSQAWNQESLAQGATRGSQELGLAAHSLVLISVDPTEFIIKFIICSKATNVT